MRDHHSGLVSCPVLGGLGNTGRMVFEGLTP